MYFQERKKLNAMLNVLAFSIEKLIYRCSHFETCHFPIEKGHHGNDNVLLSNKNWLNKHLRPYAFPIEKILATLVMAGKGFFQ